jgi:hypothetical protein
VGRMGWHKGSTRSATPRRYFFTIPSGAWAAEFSVGLTWHRDLAVDYSTSTLTDLNLSLRAASGFTAGDLIRQSVSVIDNVEHVHVRHLPAGSYVLEVSAPTDGVTYGLAWRSRLGNGPQAVLTRSGSTSSVQMSGLDPVMSYTLEASADLTSWTAVHSFRTADSVPATTASWTETNGSARRFYRLRWVW